VTAPYTRLALLLCLLPFAGSIRTAHAERDPDQFPLRVHIFERSATHVKRYDAYKGEGKANLIEADQILGMEFSYDCSYKFHSNESDQYYPARWKHEGSSLDILMGVYGSETKTHTCELKVILRDTVFRKVKGSLQTMSPAEYAGLDEAKAERQQGLAPADLDPSHYPIQISLMHLTWTDTIDGLHIGSGQGNIITPDGPRAVDFSLHCPVIVQPTPEGRYLVASWVQPGTHMLLLLRSIDVDGAPGATCDLNTVVEPDVYVRSSGGVKAVSPEEYRTKYASTGAPSPR
jgi:hypothetical protein